MEQRQIILTPKGFRVASRAETVFRRVCQGLGRVCKIFYKQYKKFIPPVWRKKVQIALAILIVCIVLIMQFWGTESPPLIVNFYDVGQGDGIHLRTADGFDVLIDGGPDERIVEKLGQNMPFWDKTIELMILTHPHSDHLVGQLGVLDRFEVKQVLSAGVLHTSDEYLMWLNKVRLKNIPMAIAQAGMNYAVGFGNLKILWPKESLVGKRISEQSTDNEKGGGLNDTSIVARLTFGKTSFLFMGDVGDEVEGQLLQDDNANIRTLCKSTNTNSQFADSREICGFASQLTADVFKVGHHGSKYSSSKEFLQAVQPKYAVIQVGKDNGFGHPSFAALYRLKQLGINILRNDKDGDVRFKSGGEGLVRF